MAVAMLPLSREKVSVDGIAMDIFVFGICTVYICCHLMYFSPVGTDWRYTTETTLFKTWG